MTLRALVVDDSPVVRKAVRYHLAIYGVRTIDEAENAFQGMALFRENPPSLVILDLMMPESQGISSRELFETIKKEAPDTPIIIASSIPYEKIRESFVGEGALDYIVKPFNQFSFDRARRKLSGIFPEFSSPRNR
ncbi:MAG: response regulator transcription factor [Candidatus Binataceae bacterium]|jgi:DNA-binding response OmpR family regulator